MVYLITLLSVLVAVSRAEDVTTVKNENVDAKWLSGYFGFNNMNNWYGCSGLSMQLMGGSWLNNWAGMLTGCSGGLLFPSTWGMNGFFAKAAEEAHSVSRRAINLDAEQLFRRDQVADSATCLNSKGVHEVYSKSDCRKYVSLCKPSHRYIFLHQLTFSRRTS
jgi:hypothetical protein